MTELRSDKQMRRMSTGLKKIERDHHSNSPSCTPHSILKEAVELMRFLSKLFPSADGSAFFSFSWQASATLELPVTVTPGNRHTISPSVLPVV
jgi:hypothetical protein